MGDFYLQIEISMHNFITTHVIFYIAAFLFRGWLLASVNGHKSGLVPANWIKILGRKTGTGKRTKEPDIIESSTSCNNLEEAFQWGKAINIDYGNIDFENVNIKTVTSTRL